MIFYLTMIISAIILLSIMFRKLFEKNETVGKVRDPRKGLTPNATNYNLETIGVDQIENMSVEEAREIIEKTREGKITSLSPKDFYALKRKIG